MTISSTVRLTTSAYALGAACFIGTALPTWAAEHPVTGETLAEEQTFTYRLLDEFPTLDPQLNETTDGANVLRDLFEGLLNQDADGNLVPGVAETYTSNDDNTVYTFTLRKEARWSNGDPVTAHDFVYAWRRAADPETASPYAWYIELTTMVNAAAIVAGETPVEELGVVALDDHTLQVTLEQSLPYFASMTTLATMAPAHQATIEAHGTAWTRPENMVSNGAYVLSEHVPNEFHTRIKSDTYWDKDNVIIETVTGLVINDENQALTRYLAGELDWTDMPAGQFPAMKEKYPDQATSVPRLCSYYYVFNLTDSGNPALQDVRVRQALSYAIDRDVIVNAVLKGGQYPAYNFAHAYTAGLDLPPIAYAELSQSERDAKAQALMEEAGLSEPITLNLIYNTSEAHKKIATVVGQMWKQKLGVEVVLNNYEWKTYLDIQAAQDFDVARSAWCGDYNEASTFLELATSANTHNDGKYANDQVDALMDEAQTMVDPNPNYAQVEAILAEDMPFAPIYHYAHVFMLNPALKGWPYNNVETNWYAKDFYKVAE